MDIESMIAVLQAAKDGKKIQCRHVRLNSDWEDILMPDWEFNCCEYRVKPEPKEYWVLEGEILEKESNYQPLIFRYEQEALLEHRRWQGSKLIHVREVME